MNLSQIVFRLMVVSFATLVSVIAASAFTNEAVKDAEALVANLKQRNVLGTASQIDVFLAKAYLVEMKFRAKQITRKTYCREASLNQKDLTEIMLSRMRDGTLDLTTRELISAKRQFYELTAFCGNG
jgi:hypothetical protein